MKIRITPETSLNEIQADFHEMYPYLKLEFFSKPHRAFKSSPAKYIIHNLEQKVGKVVELPKTGELNLEPDMPTWKAEKLFEETFGLFVQVLRKSGETWLVTSVTDKLTLEQQNAKGRASEHVHFISDDPIDYREQE